MVDKFVIGIGMIYIRKVRKKMLSYGNENIMLVIKTDCIMRTIVDWSDVRV